MEKYSLISVVICTYNRCESLKDTLDSLLNQEYDGSFDWEVLVVDNNSKDKTKEVVESYKAKFNGRLRYVFEPKQGISYARNKGIEEAKGEIIAFTDDDVIVDKKYLISINNIFSEYNCDAVGGKVLPLYPPNTPKWIKENKEILNGPIPFYDYGDNIRLYTKAMLPFIGANMAFKRVCVNQCGLFREDLGAPRTMGEDTEFFRRLEKLNKNILYCGNILVWHKADKTRLNIIYIIKWSIMSGRYAGIKERENQKITFIYYAGIPRYLLRKIYEYLVVFLLNLFCPKKRLEILCRISFILGIMLEYKFPSQKIYQFKQ